MRTTYLLLSVLFGQLCIVLLLAWVIIDQEKLLRKYRSVMDRLTYDHRLPRRRGE